MRRLFAIANVILDDVALGLSYYPTILRGSVLLLCVIIR
jgi:hypothetical protein